MPSHKYKYKCKLMRTIFITNTYQMPNDTLQGPSKLLGSLPFKGNANDNHPHHNPLDAHKVDFLRKYFDMNIFSLEFDCTVRNITNLDFSIYVSFCVSCQKMKKYTQLHVKVQFKRDIHFMQISAALEFPADLLSIVGLEWLGRRSKLSTFKEESKLLCLRWSAALSMLAVGLTILPCAWLTDQPMPQAIFAMAGRFFATYAMNTGFQFSVEVI